MLLEAVAEEWEQPVAVDEEAARLRRGDPEAAAALVNRYQHRLYRYLLRFVGDGAAAEDLFQQTWLKVIQNIRRYDARKSFDPWLFSVAHNVAIDHLRRRQPQSLDEEAALCREEPAATESDAFERLLAAERARLLAAAIAELPAPYREVLTLRFEEDMKLEEIAGVMGTPLSTAKSRLRRGMEGLRRILQTQVDSGERR